MAHNRSSERGRLGLGERREAPYLVSVAHHMGQHRRIRCQKLRWIEHISSRGRAWSAEQGWSDVGPDREARLFLAVRSPFILRTVAICTRDSKVASLGAPFGANLCIQHLPSTC